MKIFKKTEEVHSEECGIVDELRQKIAEGAMPAAAEKVALEELSVLSRISPSSAEYTIGITYIDYLVGLPWNKRTEDNLDLKRAEAILNEDHYGQEKTKERILEHLAVKALRRNRKPNVLVVDDEEIVRQNLSHLLG